MSKPDSHYSIEVSNIRASDENTTNAEKSDSLESSGRVYNPDCPHTPTDGHNIDVALPLSRPEEAVVSQLHESSLLDVNDDLHADAPNLIAVEQSLWTRNYCLGALALTWVLGVALLVAGIILLLHPQPAWMSHGSRTEIATIATNVCLTAILEGDGFIHATALRWALHSDRQLTFNSNLRLFTSSPSSKSNSWYCNFAYAIATVIAYAAASLLFQRALNKTGVTTVHPAALLLLGATLLPIAALVTWSYIGMTLFSHPGKPIAKRNSRQSTHVEFLSTEHGPRHVTP